MRQRLNAWALAFAVIAGGLALVAVAPAPPATADATPGAKPFALTQGSWR